MFFQSPAVGLTFWRRK